MRSSNFKLINSLIETFNGDPWYGDSVMKKLKEIDFKIVNETSAHSSNTIAMIVQHLINWRTFAIEKLKGNSEFDILLNSKEDWAEIIISNEIEWNELLLKLEETQNEIIKILTIMDDDEFLKTQTPGRNYNFEYLINGIIQHDIYHLGQIGIITAKVKA